ncbi:MAG TPA: DUF2807 domain-containing protein [Mucilaginibacter sp.]|jgi:hypothetical protein|nr:DUF2807 domain-containing protein [Mucilaginibacter sp.]
MKTQIITILTALTLIAGVAETSKAAVAKSEDVTVLTDVSAINKIEVRGNVLLYISDGSADQVKVYNKYYAESALVKSRNGVLSIASYKAEKLVVWVTAADLSSIAAYDNSEVKTFGDVSKIEFNVELHNNATAKLSFDAITANVTLTDNAKADLSGTATEVYLTHSVGSSVNRTNLLTDRFTEKKTGLPVPAKSDDITAL